MCKEVSTVWKGVDGLEVGRGASLGEVVVEVDGEVWVE